MKRNMSEETKNVLKVLDYWFVMEFFDQPDLKAQKRIGARALTYKNNIRYNPNIKKKKRLEDFVVLKEKNGINNLETIVQENSEYTGLPFWGNFTIYLGKIKKEICIKEIAKTIKSKDLRPEENNDEIAVATIKITKDGKYIRDSLSISPLLWAIKEIKDGFENIGTKLSPQEYKKDVQQIENMISELFVENEETNEKYESKNFSVNVDYSTLASCLQQILNSLKISDICDKDSLIAIYYKSFEKEKNVEEDLDSGLHMDFFSEDLNMVADKIRHGDISEKKLSILTDYIIGPYRNRMEKRIPKRFDILNTQDTDELYHFFVNNLTLRKAPLGKWPSKFMPVLMQQVAINLAIKDDQEIPIFSVNGPPGTGKTSLLKEIVVNNVIKKAVLLAQYSDADDAFNDYYFEEGDDENNSYNKWVKKYHRLKNKKINEYSILVTSSNNTAVENITKELPVENNLIKNLKPKEIKTYNDRMLDELANNFRVANSSDTIIRNEIDYKKTEDDNGITGWKVETKTFAERDIYFSYLATNLLNGSEKEGKENSKQAFALVSASLGKKENINKVETNVIKTLLSIMKTNKDINKRKEKYTETKEHFLEQLNIVQELQRTQDHILAIQKEHADIIIKRKNEEIKVVEKKLNIKQLYGEKYLLQSRLSEELYVLKNNVKKHKIQVEENEFKIKLLEADIVLNKDSVAASEKQIQILESSIKGFLSFFKKTKKEMQKMRLS